MPANKIVYNKKTLIDLTGDTVEAENVLSGYTAHRKDGSSITGTVVLTTYTTSANTLDSSGSKLLDSSGNAIMDNIVYQYRKL
jgi:hypothetical protein